MKNLAAAVPLRGDGPAAVAATVPGVPNRRSALNSLQVGISDASGGMQGDGPVATITTWRLPNPGPDSEISRGLSICLQNVTLQPMEGDTESSSFMGSGLYAEVSVAGCLDEDPGDGE